ncbi:hypothetical protein RHMOL_Rhmol05G0238800 [Rhododendron molle]|uniref:Uncharacterized protein n=1 Tax=Rhododendron molle TaxID=49168 RepID=A0ACC0NUR4_RHOML|nr:hypothetical protein RHMOL_Rhmol05G0238800 [Rhododendron molle]
MTENSMSRLFHTNQNFKVIPEGWDGTTKDPDEVHYDISMKEDETLYQEFVQRMNFNKMKGPSTIRVAKPDNRKEEQHRLIEVPVLPSFAPSTCSLIRQSRRETDEDKSAKLLKVQNISTTMNT